jgi:dTDP-4-dehydrorhamnose 3,5-epimerase-like enzyme
MKKEDSTMSIPAEVTSKCNRNATFRHRLIDLRQFPDPRGSLVVVESGQDIGFPVRRIYYMYGAAPGAARGAHAHRKLEQLIVAVHGSFDIALDDGRYGCSHHLDEPTLGLYITPMVWRDITNFSADSVCLVLASELYDEADYIRDYECFIQESA